MHSQALLEVEHRQLERAWTDEAGRRYVSHYLDDLLDHARDIERAMTQFDQSLPRPPARI